MLGIPELRELALASIVFLFFSVLPMPIIGTVINMNLRGKPDVFLGMAAEKLPGGQARG